MIANDSIGQRPIYYSVRGSRLVFGGSVKSILQDKNLDRSVDHEGLSDLFEYRYVLGKKTLFEHISLLEPGSRLIYDLAGNSVDLQSDPSLDDWFGSPADGRAPKVVLDELAESFSVGVQRICDSLWQNTVSLSGGMDSRVVMAAIRPSETKNQLFQCGTPRQHRTPPFKSNRPGSWLFGDLLRDRLGDSRPRKLYSPLPDRDRSD